MAERIADVGKNLNRAGEAYNKAVGSLEQRVLPAARKFKDLGVTAGQEIKPLQPIESTTRKIESPELTEEPE
jgi:DNA recombination protein RmuC